MGQDVKNDSGVCRIPPFMKNKGLSSHLRPNPILVAVSLSLILVAAGLAYYWLLPPPLDDKRHGPYQPVRITIDGDADFSAVALLKGWPGDGSPENPFIVDGLDIDLSPDHDDCLCVSMGSCFTISNTRVDFIIRNCNVTGASAEITLAAWPGAGIALLNVTNGELVNNTCSSNSLGILLYDSHSNTVANNTCNSNDIGISLKHSDSNTVANNTIADNTVNNNHIGIGLGDSIHNTIVDNTCNNNHIGIGLGDSNHNTIADNTVNNNWVGIGLGTSNYNIVLNNMCNSNDIGISLERMRNRGGSVSNTVENNNCNNNRIGIYLDDRSEWNTVENNTFSGNTEHDISEESATE